MPSTLDNDFKLHPLLSDVVDLIRSQRVKLFELEEFEIANELTNIYGDLDGNQLFIKNELHKAKCFRKLHLEIAKLGPSLQILHCVFFPEPIYDLPIFGVDIVATLEEI